MEILNPIREKVKRIKELGGISTLESIILHIERAEYFYLKGKSEKEEHFFTDVIYRTNQAFEGCSRQAYMILANKEEIKVKNTKAYQIEEYFIDNEILHKRVSVQFENYRSNWRNESAHNYNLFFDESDAYFAILNVAAYAHVLFNQIISKISYDLETKKIRESDIERRKIKGIMKGTKKSLREKISMLIAEFANGNEFLTPDIDTDHIEIVSMLASFIESSSENITVHLDRYFNGNKKYLVDLLVEYNGEKLVIEIKRFFTATLVDNYIEQIIHYLEEAKISDGILYFTTTSYNGAIFSTEDIKKEKEKNTYNISIVKT